MHCHDYSTISSPTTSDTHQYYEYPNIIIPNDDRFILFLHNITRPAPHLYKFFCSKMSATPYRTNLDELFPRFIKYLLECIRHYTPMVKPHTSNKHIMIMTHDTKLYIEQHMYNFFNHHYFRDILFKDDKYQFIDICRAICDDIQEYDMNPQ